MAFTTITAGQTDANSPVDQVLMDLVRTNLDDLDTRLAVAEGEGVTNGDSHDHSGGDGAALVSGSFTAGAVDQSAVGNNAVGQEELKTATGSFNSTIGASSSVDVETHKWGHTPSVGSSNSSDVSWGYDRAAAVELSGEVAQIRGINGAGANRTGHLEWIYHNA